VYREKEDEIFLFYDGKYRVFHGKSLVLKREEEYQYNILYVFVDGHENFVIVYRLSYFGGAAFILLNEKMEPLIKKVTICDIASNVEAMTRHPSGYYLAVLSGNKSELLLYREDFTLAGKIELPTENFRGFKIDKLITEACTGRVIAQMKKKGEREGVELFFWVEIKIEPFLPEQEGCLFGVSPDRGAERTSETADRGAERKSLSPEDLWLAEAWNPPPPSPPPSLKHASLIFLTLGVVLYFFSPFD